MSEVSKTTVSASEVLTPKLIANEISCDLMTSIHAGTLSSNVAYIKDLVVDKISIAGETEGNSIGNETYEVPMFGEIKLDFSDDFNGKYLICNENDLVEDSGVKILTIDTDVPEELGARLVCRYLILDLRKVETDIITTWPANVQWLYGTPLVEPGYFYVFAFQRLAKDLIVGNVNVKILS
jgi:hypothetical protein